MKLSPLLVFLIALPIGLSAYANTAPPPDTEHLLSKEYGRLVVDDAVQVVTAPARWDRREWLLAGVSTGAVVALGAWGDEPIEEEVGRRGRTSDRVARIFGPFGYEYAPIVLGVFEAGGLAFRDERALQTAHDGIAASLIATGLVTGSLKMAFGRTRPFDEEGPHHFSPFSGDDSFPSGHTTEAFALATVISEHYDPLWVKFASYGTATLVGYSRMETGSHWASDAVAGALIGTLVAHSVVHFNRERRYQLFPVAENGIVGVKAVRTF